jgi:RNA polymerase sigma-70 factor (ECF subfamily)
VGGVLEQQVTCWKSLLTRAQPSMSWMTFDERLGHGKADDVATLDVHLALEKLEALDPRGARVAELRLFGGLTVAEIAHVVGTSARTVDSDWAVARRWLARELGG